MGMTMKKTMLIISVALIAVGLVTSIAGFAVVAQANHDLRYWNLGEDLSHHRNERNLGVLFEWAGVALLFVGLLLLLAVRLGRPKSAERTRE